MKKFLTVLTLVFVLMLTSCSLDKDTSTKTPPQNEEVISEEQKICEYVLYYPDSQAQKLNSVVMEASKENTEDPLFVLRELLKVQGSEDGKYINVIPSDTVINSCSVKDGICTVDLGKAFLNIKGTATQQMAMYSIVNTLCELDKVDSVQFLIDGKKVEIFGGYIFDEPFESDSSIIAE